MRDLPEPTTPRTPPKVARKRIPWSPEQEQTLIGGVQDGYEAFRDDGDDDGDDGDDNVVMLVT